MEVNSVFLSAPLTGLVWLGTTSRDIRDGQGRCTSFNEPLFYVRELIRADVGDDHLDFSHRHSPLRQS